METTTIIKLFSFLLFLGILTCMMSFGIYSENKNTAYVSSPRINININDIVKKANNEERKNEINRLLKDYKIKLKKFNMNIDDFNLIMKECEKYDLDIYMVLAMVKLESGFNSSCRSHNYKDGVVKSTDEGYFQLNNRYSKQLLTNLGFENKPMDPKINIKAGIYKIYELKKHWQKDSYETNDLMMEKILSSYNKGIAGYKNHGKAVAYIEVVKKNMNELKKYKITKSEECEI